MKIDQNSSLLALTHEKKRLLRLILSINFRLLSGVPDPIRACLFERKQTYFEALMRADTLLEHALGEYPNAEEAALRLRLGNAVQQVIDTNRELEKQLLTERHGISRELTMIKHAKTYAQVPQGRG